MPSNRIREGSLEDSHDRLASKIYWISETLYPSSLNAGLCTILPCSRSGAAAMNLRVELPQTQDQWAQKMFVLRTVPLHRKYGTAKIPLGSQSLKK